MRRLVEREPTTRAAARRTQGAAGHLRDQTTPPRPPAPQTELAPTACIAPTAETLHARCARWGAVAARRKRKRLDRLDGQGPDARVRRSLSRHERVLAVRRRGRGGGDPTPVRSPPPSPHNTLRTAACNMRHDDETSKREAPRKAQPLNPGRVLAKGTLKGTRGRRPHKRQETTHDDGGDAGDERRWRAAGRVNRHGIVHPGAVLRRSSLGAAVTQRSLRPCCGGGGGIQTQLFRARPRNAHAAPHMGIRKAISATDSWGFCAQSLMRHKAPTTSSAATQHDLLSNGRRPLHEKGAGSNR